MKETNGFPSVKIDTHLQVSGKVNFQRKKNVLGSCKSGWKEPSVCKETRVKDLVQLLSVIWITNKVNRVKVKRLIYRPGGK